MIQKQELIEIQQQFNKVLQYSQCIDQDLNTDDLFDKWYKAKSYFIRRFGGSIIEFPNITFSLGESERQNHFDEFISWIDHSLNNQELINFLLFEDIKSFFDNTVLKDYKLSEDKTISRGMRLSKALKFFVSNPKTLDKIQTTMSMMIQEDKIKGTLCFSVHPLDFLSVSENSYNWRSCHSLDGEYRAGNLSYMVDNSTIVCYLKHNNENVYIPHFGPEVPWNSKKWRCLLYAADNYNAWFAGRQYPFVANGALSTVRTLLLNIMGYSRSEWTQWTNSTLNDFKYTYIDGTEEHEIVSEHICLRHKLYDINKLVTDAEGSRQFNDLLHSSCYIPYYMFNSWDRQKLHFTIGGPTNCIICGQNQIECTDTMLCGQCITKYGTNSEDYFTCDRCGATVHIEDGYWVDDDNYHVCEHCASTQCSECEQCGELFFNEDIKFDEETQSNMCEYCYEAIKEARNQNGEGNNG